MTGVSIPGGGQFQFRSAPGQMEMNAFQQANAFGDIGALHQDATPLLDRLRQMQPQGPQNTMNAPGTLGGMLGGLFGGVANTAKPASPPQQFQRAPQYPTNYAGLAAAPIGSSFRPQGM